MNAMPAISLDGLPAEPTGFRILIRIPKLDARTKGGIIKPDQTVKLEETATIVGEVLALGPLAYKDEEKFPDGAPWCQEGDYIIMRAYSGTKFKVDGVNYRLINDDTVEAVTNRPFDIERAD